MAKTESTAVNALIDLANKKPIDFGDDSADLMFRSPAALVAPSAQARPPRMTGPIPALRGAGEVAPLPRAAHGTQTDMAPAIRMVTAPPARMTTIPPLATAAPSPSRPSGTMPPIPTRTTRPSLPPPRVTAQRAAEGTPAPELFSRTGAPPPLPSTRMPVAAPFESAPPAPPVVARAPQAHPVAPVPAVDQTNNDTWFEATRDAHKVDVDVDVEIDAVDQTWSGTLPVPRQTLGGALRRYALPGTLLVLGAIGVGGYFALAGRHTIAPVPTTAPAPRLAVASVVPVVAPTPAPVAVAAAAPVAPTETAPVVAPVTPVAAAPAPAVVAPPVATAPTPGPTVAHLVSVRFDSQPAGATVMLVDGGKTSFLGTAPVDASVDSSRAYDVVFTLEGHPTTVQHLDAAATQHVTALLSGSAPAAPQVAVAVAHAPTPAPVAPAPVHHHAAPAPLVPAPTAPEAPTKARAPAKAAPAAAGTGVLMVSSKPPCDIVIDGRPTGLTTPQRAIALPAGSHRVTLVNASENLTKTVNVTITADQPTKLIQNLLK